MYTLTKRDLLSMTLSIPHQLGREYLQEACRNDPALLISAAFACGYTDFNTTGCWNSIGTTLFRAYECLIHNGKLLAHWHDAFVDDVICEHFESKEHFHWGVKDLFGDVEYVDWTPNEQDLAAHD